MIYLSLGSNTGMRLNHLRQAAAWLAQRGILTTVKSSVVLETPALLPDEGAPKSWNRPYLNAIVRGESTLTPLEMLAALQAIERDMGRSFPHKKWAPRVIDIDILLWNDQAFSLPGLTVPHPQLAMRPFLLYLLGQSPSVPPILRTLILTPGIVGIVNVTPDSFSDGGRFLPPARALYRTRRMMKDGACVVDIGAQSTRPGAILIDAEEEWRRLSPVLKGCSTAGIPLSLDSFNPIVVARALQHYPLAWVNDQAGLFEPELLRAIAARGCSIVTMHARGIPPTKAGVVEGDIWAELSAWASARVIFLEQCGFARSHIILDPGIGFGKTPSQTLDIIRNIDRLKTWGCPILVGHSRKSFLTSINPQIPAPHRDIETLAFSHYLAQKGVDYLRVHACDEHVRFFAAHQTTEISFSPPIVPRGTI